MGRQERKRWEDNDRAADLVKASESRPLLPEEVEELRQSYTGYGGLHSSTWGQFFTPQEVTRFVVELLDVDPNSKILEPSCGAGAFFAQLPKTCDITGVEMMREAASVSNILYPYVQVRQGNTLIMLEEFEGQFDLVIGNPPYCSIPKHEDYSGYTIAQKGKDRAEWYFLELGLRALKPGGWLAFVVPDGILGNKKDEPLRAWLTDKAWVRGVVSLPEETFKLTGTTVKTSVLLLQRKLDDHDVDDYPIFMAVSSQIGWNSRGKETGKCDLPEILAAWWAHRRQSDPLFMPSPSIQDNTTSSQEIHLIPPSIQGTKKADGWEQLPLFG